MRLTLIASLLLAIVTPGLAQDEMVTLQPAQVGEIFCLARLGNDMGPVTGLLSPGLTKAIADAEVNNTAWEQANPGDKPPLGDGIPWQSWPDYAPECTVGEVTVNAAGLAEVEIHYNFPSTPHAGYSDTLLLAKTAVEGLGAEVWRIGNLRFEDGNDLVAELVRAFNEEGA
ncbi:MAG: hypothetical protein ABIO40_04385 [Devosia sp.]